MIKQAVEAALHAEMTDHLGHGKHAAEVRGSGNPRNELTAEAVQTTTVSVDLEVLRDRNGAFDPITVAKDTRRLTDFDDMIFSLYAKGITTRDIAENLEAT
jgi:putative transposase